MGILLRIRSGKRFKLRGVYLGKVLRVGLFLSWGSFWSEKLVEQGGCLVCRVDTLHHAGNNLREFLRFCCTIDFMLFCSIDFLHLK